MIKNQCLSVENNEISAVIRLRFDAMDEGRQAWLVAGWGKLAVAFDDTALDIDLNQLCYGISVRRRRWRIDPDRYNQTWWIDRVSRSNAPLVGDPLMSAITMIFAYFTVRVVHSLDRWNHYRIVLNDGRAFEFIVKANETSLTREVERLRRRCDWSRRFKHLLSKLYTKN